MPLGKGTSAELYQKANIYFNTLTYLVNANLHQLSRANIESGALPQTPDEELIESTPSYAFGNTFSFRDVPVANMYLNIL
jgi:hypothetical protein